MLRMGRRVHAADRHEEPGAWPAAWRSTAWPTAGCCARARSRTSGSSRPPAMPAARSGPRCSSGISCSRSRGTPNGRDSQKASLARAVGTRRATIETFLDETRRAATSASPTRTRCSIAWPTLLARGKVVGWFHGRAEFGPRALGARSILGDPRSAEMQATMNLKIKFRESFRPFAPVVLREHVHEWFAMRPGRGLAVHAAGGARCSRSAACRCRTTSKRSCRAIPTSCGASTCVRSTVPAITHVDYSARVQTVDERHGRFHRLMQRFHEKTGCPVLVNTSFNLSWEPIVLTPEEAYHTFMQSEMDVLVLENCRAAQGRAAAGPSAAGPTTSASRRRPPTARGPTRSPASRWS